MGSRDGLHCNLRPSHLLRISEQRAKEKILVQPRSQFWHDGLTETVHYSVAPQSFGFFADTGEGVQFIRGDDTAAWGYNPETRDTTFGDICCAASDAELVAELRPLPFGFVVQQACTSIGPVPQPFLPKDGEAVSPALVMTKYKPGKGPTATRQLARRGLPYVIVHGALPYLYTFMEKLTMGYHTVSDRLDDREGFYYFYRLLKPLAGYRFSEYYAPVERALSASADGIECALMVSDEGTVVVLLTSIAAAVATDVVLKPSAEAAGLLRAETWSKARMIASTRAAAVSLSGHPPAIALDTVHPDELYILEITRSS